MNAKYIGCLMLFLFLLAVALPAFSSSSRANVDVCDPKIVGQIQQGKSSQEDVKKLIGEPDKVEGALNQGELWKYSAHVTAHSGSGTVSTFGSSGKRGMGSGGISMGKTKCNLWVYFEKNGIVRKVSQSDISGGSGLMK